MTVDFSRIMAELTEEYGVSILEDPDRLSQLLENRCSQGADEVFHLTFALRELIRDGWSPASHDPFIGKKEKKRLRELLGFTEEQAEKTAEIINSALERDNGTRSAQEHKDLVAVPGNLKPITGGVSSRPRHASRERKNLSGGIIIIAAVFFLMMLFFQIGRQRTPVGDELRVAYFAPMSGAEARSAHVRLRAAQLAVERVNSIEAIKGGYRLKVIGFDLPREPEEAEKAVETAMKDKSFLVMMLADDNCAETVAKVAERLEVPLVIVSENPPLTEEMQAGAFPLLYSFSLANDTSYRGKMLSYFASQALLSKNVAYCYNISDPASREIFTSSSKWAEAFGMTVAAEIPFTGKDAKSRAQVAKAAAESSADVVIVTGLAADKSGMTASLRGAGFSGLILGEGYTEMIYKEAGSAAAGSWWINEVSSLDPAIRSVLKNYKRLYNEECPQEEVVSAILSYDGVMWIASALGKAPGFRGEAIRHTLLATMNLPLTHATLTIDPRTHTPLNKAMALVHCADGRGIFQRRIRISKE
ncbi:MAG: ABC transporter substrate-binding protein [Synergistes sp.]|nr:ABC transporter substrate-binding protein [Synergistes sp.]